MNITCDLYGQWIRAIRAELGQKDFDHSGLPDQDCAIVWTAWKRRTILAGHRVIVTPDDFHCPEEHEQGLADLREAFKSGNEVWPWQSTKIGKIDFEDDMYNDFGIMHFHLGDGFINNGSGYINRTGKLLYAVVQADAVYEIGIYDHSDWCELGLLNRVDQLWPELLDPFTLKGFDRLSHSVSSREDIKTLRKGNATTYYMLDSGRAVVMCGGGTMTDGTSGNAVMTVIQIAKFLRNGEKSVVEDIESKVSKMVFPDQDYRVHLDWNDGEIAAVIAEPEFRWILKKANA